MVRLFLDFDSTITEDSTLMQLYLRLPKELLEKAINVSNEEYYKNEKPLTDKCYSDLIKIIKDSKKWEECLRLITTRILQYSKEIDGIERKGMKLIEEVLKNLDSASIKRASSQVILKHGFQNFVGLFGNKDVYVLSFNWSDYLIRYVCPSIKSSNIISNKLIFNDGKCFGFDWHTVLLTPEHKIKYFNKLKSDRNIFCGDSLPDLLPCISSDFAFAFQSHDKDFLLICNMLKEKYSRKIFIVKDFNEAKKIYETLVL